MFINPPSKQFISLFHYSVFMMWNADRKKVRKYLVFLFLTIFTLDLFRMAQGREMPIPFPLASFVTASIFLIIYLMVNTLLRIKRWTYPIKIAESSITFLTPKKEIEIRDIQFARKIGDRILEIGIGKLDRTIDLVFPDKNSIDQAHTVLTEFKRTKD